MKIAFLFIQKQNPLLIRKSFQFSDSEFKYTTKYSRFSVQQCLGNFIISSLSLDVQRSNRVFCPISKIGYLIHFQNLVLVSFRKSAILSQFQNRLFLSRFEIGFVPLLDNRNIRPGLRYRNLELISARKTIEVSKENWRISV